MNMLTEITMLPVILMGISFFGKGKSVSSSSCAPCNSSEKNLPDEAKESLKVLHENGIGFLTAEQLRQKLSSGTPPILVDVLPADSYRESHIKGSINIPHERIEEWASGVIPDMSAEVVVFCASYSCPASIEAARTLKRLGYTNVHDFKGGMKEWMDRKYPVEGYKARGAKAA
jgi:rhodanese-related sulfurtransferase